VQHHVAQYRNAAAIHGQSPSINKAPVAVRGDKGDQGSSGEESEARWRLFTVLSLSNFSASNDHPG
jgi:hypothetical protein